MSRFSQPFKWNSLGFCSRWMVFIVAATAVAMFVHEAQAYEVVPVAGGATLAGKIVFNGSVPMRKIIPTKDPQICGGIRDVALVTVGADNGVKNAVAYLKKMGSGKAWTAAESQMTPVLDQKKCQFAPHVQVIRRGSLDILNSDPILHNTHGFYGKRTAFNLAMPNQNETISADLKRPGLVRIECDAHGWMLAWVHVADSPYYVVTDENGMFKITDIPPGEYTLVVWQEFTGTVEQPLVVRAGETTEMFIELEKM